MADISEKTWLRFRIGAVVVGFSVFASLVWQAATFSAGIDSMREDMQKVLEGQRDLAGKIITRDQAEIYMKTAEAMNEGWKAPPIK